YKKARGTWEGPSASLDALRLGRTSFSRNPEEIASEFEALSDSNKEFYRMGLADVLKERINKTGFTGDESKSILKNNWMKAQMRPAFGSEAEYNSFIDNSMSERKMFGTMQGVMGGSQTAERLAADAGASGGVDTAFGVAKSIADIARG